MGKSEEETDSEEEEEEEGEIELTTPRMSKTKGRKSKKEVREKAVIRISCKAPNQPWKNS